MLVGGLWVVSALPLCAEGGRKIGAVVAVMILLNFAAPACCTCSLHVFVARVCCPCSLHVFVAHVFYTFSLHVFVARVCTFSLHVFVSQVCCTRSQHAMTAPHATASRKPYRLHVRLVQHVECCCSCPAVEALVRRGQ